MARIALRAVVYACLLAAAACGGASSEGTFSEPVTQPGSMYPDPPIDIVPTAAKVEDFPYVTEEYFVSGSALELPFVTRIIVRRPTDSKAFSGTVVAEPMHPRGRSLVFEWSRVSILKRNHVFVEIVHSPANGNLLRQFDEKRYADIQIAPGQGAEILASIGRLIKMRKGPFAPYDVKRVMLMGTTASSAAINAYLAVDSTIRMPDGGSIFDGYLIASTTTNTPPPMVDAPMIQLQTQTEVERWAGDGIAYRRPDSDERGNQFRLYEVAGMPTNNARDRPEFQGDPCLNHVSDFNSGAFTALALNHLIEWAANGKVPPHAPYIEVDNNRDNDGSLLALDQFGNAKGGVRNVWVDVPTATYGVFGKGKTEETQRLCELAGTETPLPPATLHKLYRSKDDYSARVSKRLDELVAQGWFLPEYVAAVRDDVKTTVFP